MDENEAKNIERYRCYKLQWMLDHGHTLEEIFRELYMIQKRILRRRRVMPKHLDVVGSMGKRYWVWWRMLGLL